MLPFKQRTVVAAAPYLFICAGLFLVFAWLASLHPQRVGDGSEYYAMFFAWNVGHRPWMTAVSYDAFDRLFALNQISGLVSREWLENAFPGLKLGATSDFNHFWFYSLLASTCSALLNKGGLAPSVHGSFLALHYLLLTLTTLISYALFGRRGVVVVLLMTFASPVFWFLDKVHTEFFTYCLTLAAVMLAYARKYLLGAVCLAFAATQNPSFGAIAILLLGYRVVVDRERRYELWEVCAFVVAVLAVLAHPVYYWYRYGVVTPQLLAGGASLGSNLSSFYIWILDPDLGLLPNWPLGVVIGLFAVAALFWREARASLKIDRLYLGFVVVYLGFSLYANSSTTNINSGATPGLARYALWYLPLAFPIVLWVSLRIPKANRVLYPIAAACVALSMASMAANFPARPEQYLRPSPVSFWIQSKLPWLYNPPPAVFGDRYSGMADGVDIRVVRGVLGPDCRKMLLFPGDNRSGITTARQCLFDDDKLSAYADSLVVGTQEPIYKRMGDEEAMGLKRVVSRDPYKVGSNGTGNFILASGWSTLEPWGVWSQADTATLRFPCDSQQFFASKSAFVLTLKIQPFGKQGVEILQGTDLLWHGSVDGPATIDFPVPVTKCTSGASIVSIKISNPRSPRELKQSDDPRRLGIGLTDFRFH